MAPARAREAPRTVAQSVANFIVAGSLDTGDEMKKKDRWKARLGGS